MEGGPDSPATCTKRPRLRPAAAGHGKPRLRARKDRQKYGGSAAYHERVQELRDGPAEASQFGAWPGDLAKALGSPRSGEASAQAMVQTHRLVNVLGGGSVVHSDYSGKGCPDCACWELPWATTWRRRTWARACQAATPVSG